jgi:hypothetical protein
MNPPLIPMAAVALLAAFQLDPCSITPTPSGGSESAPTECRPAPRLMPLRRSSTRQQAVPLFTPNAPRPHPYDQPAEATHDSQPQPRIIWWEQHWGG